MRSLHGRERGVLERAATMIHTVGSGRNAAVLAGQAIRQHHGILTRAYGSEVLEQVLPTTT
jgi:hypothetical protein